MWICVGLEEWRLTMLINRFAAAHHERSNRPVKSWLSILGLSVALLALGGCSSEPVDQDEDPSGADDDANDDDASDEDDEVVDAEDGDGDGDGDGEDDEDDEDDDTSPLDAGMKDASGGGAKDAAGGGAKDAAGGSGSDASSPGKSDAGGDPVTGGGNGNGSAASCASLPPATDYGAKGPFADAKMISNVGPNKNYTLFRPDSSLGKDGFKHPIATWGNGIVTTPNLYEALLTTIASHGFVIIAANDTMAERPALSAGLDWLIEQDKAGDMAGKLDTAREVTIGYSWGGGAAIDTANRPNVKATVSFHGMPPRGANAFKDMHSPLLLFTSTGDTFVSASGYVTPNYMKSTVQTFYATLADTSADHLYVLGDAGKERGPAIAWLRYWACDDQKAREFYFGDDCVLCKAPWTMPQRKNWMD